MIPILGNTLMGGATSTTLWQTLVFMVIQNYVDQILPNFDPPRMKKMNILHTVYRLSRDPRGLSTDPLPPKVLP